MIYFAQIVMLRLRKISPNCAQIVLEKKKSHIFYSQDRNFYWKITNVFEKIEKKNEKILETKNQC